MTKRTRTFAIAVAAMAVSITAFAGPVLAADKFVTMYANEYRPRVVTINVGNKVTWVNDDDVQHDAVGNGWSISLLGYYESASLRFNRAGTYRYRCSIHPAMTGTVRVLGAGGVGTAPDTDRDSGEPGQDGGWPGQLLAVLGIVMLVGTSVLDRLLRQRSAARA